MLLIFECTSTVAHVIKVEWWALGGKKKWSLSSSSCGIFHSISPNLCGYKRG
jgi:hypothetical protein